jgi:hypothetical protein
MKRGIEILVLWLLVIAVVDFFFPVRSVPRNGTEVMFDQLTILAFPLAAWVMPATLADFHLSFVTA